MECVAKKILQPIKNAALVCKRGICNDILSSERNGNFILKCPKKGGNTQNVLLVRKSSALLTTVLVFGLHVYFGFAAPLSSSFSLVAKQRWLQKTRFACPTLVYGVVRVVCSSSGNTFMTLFGCF